MANMNHIKQLRYFGETQSSDPSKYNYPSDLSAAALITGNAFVDYSPIVELSIQALPGTKFYLNDGDPTTPIIVGVSGIFELNLTNEVQITSLKFDAASLKTISDNDNAVLIIDLLYRGN